MAGEPSAVETDGGTQVGVGGGVEVEVVEFNLKIKRLKSKVMIFR